MTYLRVGLVANTRYADLHPVLVEAVNGIVARGWQLAGDEELAAITGCAMLPLDPDKLDLLITFGGDGTLLRGARVLAGRPVPVLGVNFGRIGFLTAVSRDEVSPALDGIAAGRHQISVRAMLEGTVCAGDGAPGESTIVLNDVVLHKGGVARVVRVNLAIDGEPVGTVSGDGIVVASPSGSTAYSLSAGGPVVTPAIDAMIITPICPHSLSVRPLVVPGDVTVRIDPVELTHSDLLISFDGQKTAPLPEGMGLSIRIAPWRMHLIRFPEVTFYRRLREKLQWGDLSGRG